MKLGIVGFPLKVTDSPKIHSGFLRSAKIKGSYRKFPFNPKLGKKKFFAFLDALKASGVAGVNVTVPFKEWAREYCPKTSQDFHGRVASKAGSANTLIFKAGACANTDAQGFWDDLEEWLGKKLKTYELCIVGTGGTSRGIASGAVCGHRFAAKRCRKIAVWGRDKRKARAIESIFPKSWRKNNTTFGKTLNSSPLVVVWTLPPLEKKRAQAVWESVLENSAGETTRELFLYDANYASRANATRNFLPTANRKTGEGMLKRQAKLSFELWQPFRGE